MVLNISKESFRVKHAYLILAHHEFDMLESLVSCIDDTRNDIFVHIDKKVEVLPIIKTKYSNLYYVEDRVDVRWGSLSVVQAEYKLFEAAVRKGDYRYFHLLSGVDICLKDQDYIHNFFELNDGKEFIGFNHNEDLNIELERKICYYHLFSNTFRGNGILFTFKRVIRALFIRLQILFHKKRNTKELFRKGTQWVSITNELILELLSHKKEVLSIYKATFCPDEIFIQTICWNSGFRDNIYNDQDESLGCVRYIKWRNRQVEPLSLAEYKILVNNPAYIYARKNSQEILEYKAE